MDNCLLQTARNADPLRFLQADIENWSNVRDSGVCPSISIPNKAIHAYARLGAWQQAVGVLRDMKTMNLERNVVSFSSAINACVKKNHWGRALQLLQEMRVESIKPDLVLYNSLLNACGKGQQWKKAVEIIKEMKTEGCAQPDLGLTSSTTSSSSGCEKGHQWNKSLRLLSEIKKVKLRKPKDGLEHHERGVLVDNQ